MASSAILDCSRPINGDLLALKQKILSVLIVLGIFALDFSNKIVNKINSIVFMTYCQEKDKIFKSICIDQFLSLWSVTDNMKKT